MQPIQCFMLEQTNKEQRSLRRFTYSTDAKCPHGDGWGHDASVKIEPGVAEGEGSTSGDLWPHDDPRWPTQCECGYEFQASDEWQLSCHRIWRRVDNGEEMTLDYRELPAGAMYWATWYSNDEAFSSTYHQQRGGGPHLMVNTPGGIWDADSMASNGPGWQWSGTPPNITANPSIGIQNNDGSWRFHGWLRDGVLTEA